jgi:AcrR family transcriptional regulator
MAAQPRASARRSAAARRDQLLDVTARLIAQSGFHGLSIETIARAAGVTRGLVYQHFRDLRGLLEAVIERETSRALAQVSETTLTNLDEGEPLELMLESLRAYLQAVQNQPTTWRLILIPLEGAPQALHAKIAEGRASVLARLSSAVQPALGEDRRLPDAELTARLLSAIADEYARLILTDPEQFPVQRLLSHARWWLARGPLVGRSLHGGSGATHGPRRAATCDAGCEAGSVAGRG